MKSLHNRGVADLLTDDILLSIFDKISLLHRKRLARVCKRWKGLIDVTFLCVNVFSAVDARRCICDWQPSGWLSLKFVPQRDYLRIPKVSASEVLSKLAPSLPNLNAIDLECCDMSNRIIRTILNSCKKVERINFDSSTRLNHYTFNLMVQEWSRLRHVNLSCCTEVNEISAKYLIERLPLLESLNLCGTRVTGNCLQMLRPTMRRLDISYCWSVQEEGLTALSQADCKGLMELSVNNFDFDRAEDCMVRLLANFKNLQHLQMSIGPCVAHDYFIDRLTNRGFSSIANLSQLETLIIEKVCILDNAALISIIRGCSKLKILKLNLGWLNWCTDFAFTHIGTLLPALEELHIMFPSVLTSRGLSSISNLKNLRAISLTNTMVDNEIFKIMEDLPSLVNINLDDSRRITLRGLTHLCKIANKRPETKIQASLRGTGIIVARLKGKKNFPRNLFAQISNFRATKYHLQLPPVIEV